MCALASSELDNDSKCDLDTLILNVHSTIVVHACIGGWIVLLVVINYYWCGCLCGGRSSLFTIALRVLDVP